MSPGDVFRHYETTDWKEYYCVLERDPLAIRIFLDEQVYVSLSLYIYIYTYIERLPHHGAFLVALWDFRRMFSNRTPDGLGGFHLWGRTAIV